MKEIYIKTQKKHFYAYLFLKECISFIVTNTFCRSKQMFTKYRNFQHNANILTHILIIKEKNSQTHNTKVASQKTQLSIILLGFMESCV